ncbi:MAG: hypothetical protein RIC35_17305 [Marinoscillum sp.]
MIKKSVFFYGLLLLLMAAMSCEPFVPVFPEGAVESFRPIYFNDPDVTITKESGRSIGTAGKIYSYGNILLINEVKQGIHVVDNTDPENPVNLFFISIPGNTDMALKDGLIYANNMSDLAVIKVSTQDFEVLQRIENVFLDPVNQNYPPGDDIFYECVDKSKGRVIGWRSAIIEAPECYKR